MNMPTLPWMTFSQARVRQRVQTLRQSDVPIEHAVSLPMPTLHRAGPAYVQFAAPSTREPGKPTVQAAPDRWWAIDARTGQLIFYALTSALPLPGLRDGFAATELPAAAGGMAQLRELHARLDTAMDALVAEFFEQRPGEPGARQQAADVLSALIPAPLLAPYRAMAPDFFSWLPR